MTVARAIAAALVAIFLLSACASSDAPEAPPRTSDRERLIARIDQFHDAIREGDKESYADVFVDDFVFTWSRNGQIYDRETILPNVVPTPDFTPLVDEVLTRVAGDSAIASFRVRQEAQEAGVRVTFSYARIDGVWKVLASHSTPIVDEPPSDP